MRLVGVLLVVALIGVSLIAAYWLLRDGGDEPEQAAAIASPSPQPAPTLDTSPQPTPWPTPNDEPVPAAVQRVFDVINNRSHDDVTRIAEVVGTADWSCSTIEALQTPGGCGSAAPSFLANLPTVSFDVCETTHQLDSAAAALLIYDRLNSHAAWSTWALTRTHLFTTEPTGYVLAYRAATGNVGVLFYVNSKGQIVGVDRVCTQGGIDRQLAARVPEPDYILEPWWFHLGY